MDEEDRPREDLGEEESPYRMEEMRKKGQVAQSKELNGIMALFAAGVALYAFAPSMGRELVDYMISIFSSAISGEINGISDNILLVSLQRALRVMVTIGFPVCLAAALVGALGSFVQIGAIFSTEPLTPNLNKINPIKGFKQYLSMRQLLTGVRLIIKIIVVLSISYYWIRIEVFRSPLHILNEPPALIKEYGENAFVIFLSLMGALFLFSAFDYAIQRWEHSKKLRMTKQEAKQEQKEREGDPLIKARIRSVQKEMARRRMMQEVKKADVIVTNPTHIAVALKYDKEKSFAPRVVAKGADFIAQKIKKVATEAGVPLVENVPLARTLFKTVKVGQLIPRNLYKAVAEILAYVYRLKNRRF